MKLFLIRHAESVGNAEGRVQGQSDYPLTERGVLQAQATADHLRTVPLTAVYTSPLTRARRTAEPIAAAQGLHPIVLPSVQEYHFGEGTGLTFAEWRQGFAQRSGTNDPHVVATPTYPGEEGQERFRERICTAVWDLCRRHKDDPAIAIVTHAGPIAVLLLDVLGLPYRRPVPFTIANCAISIVHIRDDRTVIETINDTCHLDGRLKS